MQKAERSSVLRESFRRKPIIPAIKDDRGLAKALGSGAELVILLHGDIFVLPKRVKAVQDVGKKALVHIDLIDGVAKDAAGVKYLAKEMGADGIVSIKAGLIAAASKLGLLTVQRLFVVDSTSLESGIRLIENSAPDAVEILPGVALPFLQSRLRGLAGRNLVAGGLIDTVEEAKAVLQAGALAISTSAEALWKWQDGMKEGGRYH